MKQRMMRKLKSRRGASITFALLLFLVCAVVSAVVIVAGTTAAGRMSQISETDQRYYAVTSAARLLRDTLEGDSLEDHKVKIESVKTTTTTSVTDIDSGSVTTTTTAPETVTTIWVDGVEKVKNDEVSVVTPLDFTLLNDAACKVAGFDFNGVKLSTPVTFPVETKLELTSGGNTALSATIEEKLQSNGSIKFVVYNKVAADATDKGVYKITMTFAGKADHVSDTYVQDPVFSNDVANNTHTVVTTTVETNTWTYSCELRNVEEKIATVKKDSD